jgi:hypothetical protein
MRVPGSPLRIEQHGLRWEVRMSGGDETEIGAALARLVDGLALTKPEIVFLPWIEQPAAEKQKRIRCLAKPE